MKKCPFDYLSFWQVISRLFFLRTELKMIVLKDFPLVKSMIGGKPAVRFTTQPVNIAAQTLPNTIGGSMTTMILKPPTGVVGGIIAWQWPTHQPTIANCYDA